jgi:cardiolipin synthase
MNKQHIPNILTISRVAAIIPITIIFTISYEAWAYMAVMFLYIYACITDFVDGYLSRKWNCVSDLGRLLDPIADKLLVAVLLVMLIPAGVSSVAVALIMVRELFISGLREFMQEKGAIIHVSKLAKWKTAMQMLACWLFLLAGMFANILLLAQFILWLAVVFTLWTGAEYLFGALKQTKNNV